jgi:hypothetical protein
MEGTTALTVPPAAQTASAPVTHTPSAVPAHIVQATQAVPTASHTSAAPAHPAQTAQMAKTSAPASPAPGTADPKTAPSAPGTTPTVADPVHDVIADAPADDNAPTPAPVDAEAEATLSAEIKRLWVLQKDNKATVRRTRAEMKSLRLALAEKLHAMKALRARTGRGGEWAKYLRLQHLPVTTADRYVAQHEARLAPPAEKDPTGELSPIDEVRQLAQKMLPKVSRLLTSQDMVYEFVHELVWNLDVAEATETDLGLEIPRTSQDESDEDEDQVAVQAIPAPVVP